MGCQSLFDMMDARGAGFLAPAHCRKNAIEADRIMSQMSPILHFIEFSLLGDYGFDATWILDCAEFASQPEVPGFFAVPQEIAGHFDEHTWAGFEFDVSCQTLPRPSLHFQGKLADGGHMVPLLLEAVGMGGQTNPVMRTTTRLEELGYAGDFCGVMLGREGAPVRIIAKLRESHIASRLVADLKALGYPCLSEEMVDHLQGIIGDSGIEPYLPLIHFDVCPDGALGSTLGLELGGIKGKNCMQYRPLALAQAWGLADTRWHALRDAVNRDRDLYFNMNTLKFRWRDGKALPAKLYLKATW